MQVIRADDKFTPPASGCAVTIGAYDGVHRGHQAVIARIREEARQRDLATAVVTFDRHPASVVRPESAPLLLTGLDHKLELLAETGVDYVKVVRFDEERATETAEDFVRNVLVQKLNAKVVAIGEDFHFGSQRGGNVELLRALGQEHGFEVHPLGLVGLDGTPARDHRQVSSTAIRRALSQGDLAAANAMLTRAYEVRGVVEEGDKRGRELGFPTANVAVPNDILMPAEGVYAGWYVPPDGSRHGTAISLGTRSTIYGDKGTLLSEAHLLNFDGDLYGQLGRVQFVGLIRGQMTFQGLDALMQQIHLDVELTRELLGL